MHIPDGFLSTPAWVGLGVAGLSAVGLLGRRVQRELADSAVPRLGVMGAFVFAAQMINFPIAAGTSGHLVGSALLTYTLGPAPAALVMSAVLVLQALVFQDGGILALGANVVNMALAAVLVAHLCCRYLERSQLRGAGMFAGGALSVLVAGGLALAELGLSGVRIPPAILGLSLGLLALNGLIEGALTLAVVRALERLSPGWVRKPEAGARPALGILLIVAFVLVTAGVLVASAAPDSLEWLAEEVGLTERARNLFETPLADYQARFIAWPWLAQATAGLAGLAAAFALSLGLGRLLVRRRRG
jgi:cobalt/nickel transport system permease protein